MSFITDNGITVHGRHRIPFGALELEQIDIDGTDKSWCMCTRAAGSDDPWEPMLKADGQRLPGSSCVAGGRGRFLSTKEGLGTFDQTGATYGDAHGSVVGDRSYACGPMAEDGTIGYLIDFQASQGLRLIALDGSVVEYPDACPLGGTVCIFDKTRASFINWHTGTLEVVGFEDSFVPQKVAGPMFMPYGVLINGEPWIIYQSTDAMGIVFHALADASVGYKIAPAGFYPFVKNVDLSVVEIQVSGLIDDNDVSRQRVDVFTTPMVSLVAPAPAFSLPTIKPLQVGIFKRQPVDGPDVDFEIVCNGRAPVDPTKPYLVAADAITLIACGLATAPDGLDVTPLTPIELLTKASGASPFCKGLYAEGEDLRIVREWAEHFSVVIYFCHDAPTPVVIPIGVRPGIDVLCIECYLDATPGQHEQVNAAGARILRLASAIAWTGAICIVVQAYTMQNKDGSIKYVAAEVLGTVALLPMLVDRLGDLDVRFVALFAGDRINGLLRPDLAVMVEPIKAACAGEKPAWPTAPGAAASGIPAAQPLAGSLGAEADRLHADLQQGIRDLGGQS